MVGAIPAPDVGGLLQTWDVAPQAESMSTAPRSVLACELDENCKLVDVADPESVAPEKPKARSTARRVSQPRLMTSASVAGLECAVDGCEQDLLVRSQAGDIPRCTES